MATARINAKPTYRVGVPSFSGGINTRDEASLINDNQLVKCENLWFKDGKLQTRPGLVCGDDKNENWKTEVLAETSEEGRDIKCYCNNENTRTINGETYFLVAFQIKKTSGRQLVFRYYKDKDTYIPIVTITEGLPTVAYDCNIFQHGTDIYCFCDSYPICIFKITSSGNDGLSWSYEKIYEDKMYAPLILTNGTTTNTVYSGLPENYSPSGDLVEGMNLLGGKYRAIYSSASETEDGCHQRWVLPFMPKKDSTVTLKIDKFVDVKDEDGADSVNVETFTYTVTKGDSDTTKYESAADRSGIYAILRGRVITLRNSDNTIAKENKDNFIRNNVEITAFAEQSKENVRKVINMRNSTWYGGGSEGINGGIHLFLSGNTLNENGNLICFSDFNKPLYFSEYATIRVGDASQKTTTLAKQGEKLIIFKEREVYALTYNSLSVNAENTVVDLSTADVVFPITQIHGFIGCDCPDTVKLCRNRLVWAHSDGKVYTLTNSNQYSEMNIYEISGMIEKQLKKESKSNLLSAHSGDWENKYLLFVGSNVYVMDYDSYGYSRVASYTKEEDAQKLIPWWKFVLPKYFRIISEENKNGTSEKPTSLDILGVVDIANEINILLHFKATVYNSTDKKTVCTHGIVVAAKFLMGANDTLTRFISKVNNGVHSYSKSLTEHNITSKLQTKFFEFGSPSIRKSIPKIELTVSENSGLPIEISAISEKDTHTKEIVLEQSADSENYFENVLIRPEIKNCYKLSLNMKAEGKFGLDALTLQYRQTGGA